MGVLQDSSGTTLMDLITADPTPAPAPASAASVPSSTAATQAPTALGKPSGERRSKRSALMQIHSDTVSAAKAALHPVRTNIMPQKHQRKKVTLSLSLCFNFLTVSVWWLRKCVKIGNDV